MMRNWVLGMAVAGLVISHLGCKKEKPKTEDGPKQNVGGEPQSEKSQRERPKGGGKKSEMEERAQLIKEREEAKQKEENAREVRRPKYTPDMLASASQEAQESFSHIAGSVGDPKSTLVVTFQDKVATEQTLVTVQVTGMDGEKLKGTVQRIDPKDKGTQLKEKDEISVGKDEIVDWTLANDKGSFGQYLIREWLKYQAEHGDNDDAKNEAKARLAKMPEPLPESAHVHAEGETH